MTELSREERAWLLREALRKELDDPRRRDELKQIFREALAEWLESKWADVGKWSVRGIGAMALTVLIYLFAKAKGLL